jgi:hypothetical protein
MSCERYATAIADHACGADLAPEVAKHLASCVGCAGQLARQRRTIEGLDAELQQLVAIEPSPFFVQRVQAHVMTSPERRSFRAWWWGAIAAAAAIVLAVLLLVNNRQPPAPIQVRTVTPPAAPTPADKPEPNRLVADSPTREEAPINRPQRVRPQRRLAKAPEPDVVVPQGQMRAVARYVELVRNGQLDTSALIASAESEDDRTPTEMVVGPLTIKPLAVNDIDSSTPSVVERRYE